MTRRLRPAIWLEWSARLARSASGWVSPLLQDIQFAFRSAARTPRRTLLTLAAIAFGVIAMLLAGGFIEWNLWYGRESTIHSQLGHIRVFRPGYLDSGFADPYKYLLPPDGPELKLIASEPHVVGIAPRLSFSGLASHRDTTLSFVGEGLDPVREKLVSSAVDIISGNDLSQNEPRGVLLGKGLAANLAVGVGDTVVLIVNTADGGVNASDATVRGLFTTITKAYDDSAIRVPLAFARRLIRASGAHSWAIVLDDTRHTDEVLAALRSKLPRSRFELVPWYELSDFYSKVAALYARQFGVVRLIIAIVMILGIGNTMMMNVLERTSEIGTGLALGRRRSSVLRLFLIEGAIFGIAGGLVGVACALLLAHVISAIGIPMPPSPGMTSGFEAGIRVTKGLAVQGFALAAIAALVASAYPAWRGSRMTIVNSLRVGR